MTAVADAIRTKAGSSESLAFPDGFVTAVEGITTGGAVGEESVWIKVLKDRCDTVNQTIRLTWSAIEITEADWEEIGVVTEIPGNICEWGKVSKCIIPETVVEIGDKAFCAIEGKRIQSAETNEYHTDPTEFEFSDTVITLSSYVFMQARLKGWPTGLNVTTLGNSAFYSARVIGSDEFVVPEGVTVISDGSLQGIEFYPDNRQSTKKVNGHIILPSTVTSITGYNSIGGPYGTPSTIIMKATTPPKIDSFSIQKNYVSSIIVPVGTLDAYKTATNWSQWADIMVEAEE